MTSRRFGALAVLAVGLLVPACNTEGFAFRTDESVEIISPEAHSTVPLPVAVRWTDSRPPAAPQAKPLIPTAEYYAVFVDRAPIGPGETLSSMAKDDDPCLPPGCPQTQFLRDNDVFVTGQLAVTIDFLDDLRPNTRASSKDPHEVTIVRMRGETRIGESAFRQTFFVGR